MSYEGYEVPIVLGQLGLQTDGPQSQLPPNAAILANNIAFFTGVLSKSNGTALYSSGSAFSHAVISGFDWWPTPSTQRMIVLTSDGKVWKDTGDGSFSSGVALKVNDTQIINWSAVPTSGAFQFKWNGNTATSANNWNDSVAAMQTQLQTITGLSTATIYANNTPGVGPGTDVFSQGMTIVIPGTNSSQPLVQIVNNTLSPTSTPTVTHILAGATGLGTITTDTHQVAGGVEVQGNPKRNFIYSGGVSQVAMITGDGGALTGINRPAADWASVYPVYGVMYQSRHIALMGHNLYISRLSDHTDFTTSETDGTGAAVFPIYPGDGDALIGGVVYKGALMLFKRPYGVYVFQWNGGDIATSTNVSISKLSDSFSAGSPHAFVQILDDLIGGSVSGSLFSQAATNAFGSLEAGDLLRQLNVRNYFRQNFDYSGIQKMTAAHYSEKLTAMFTGRDNAANPQNRILVYDESSGQNVRISVENKDQPTCLFMRKDSNLVPRPYYGADNGYVYKMDQSAWNVNGAAYTGEFQTPYIDFSFLEPKLADKKKLFEFLSVTYQAIGSWAFYVDCYVDGVFCTTLTFNMKQTGVVLDSFVLDVNQLGAPLTAVTMRLPMKSCAGNAISFRIYNGLLNQSFTIERLTVSFRESGEQNRSSKS